MLAIQDVDYTPITPLGILALAVAQAVISWLSAKLYDGLKTIIPQYDSLPSWIHQVAAPLLGFLFGFISTATGTELITDVHGISSGVIGGLLNALVMAGIKRWEKQSNPVDATMVLDQTRLSSKATVNAKKLGRPRKPFTPDSVHRSTSPGTPSPDSFE